MFQDKFCCVVDNLFEVTFRELLMRYFTRLIYLIAEKISPGVTYRHLLDFIPSIGALSQPLLDLFVPVNEIVLSLTHCVTLKLAQLILLALLTSTRCRFLDLGAGAPELLYSFKEHVQSPKMAEYDEGLSLLKGARNSFFTRMIMPSFYRADVRIDKDLEIHRRNLATRHIVFIEVLQHFPKLCVEIFQVITRAYFFNAPVKKIRVTALMLSLEKLLYISGLFLSGLVFSRYKLEPTLYDFSHGTAFFFHHVGHIALAVISSKVKSLRTLMESTVPTSLHAEETFFRSAYSLSEEELLKIKSAIPVQGNVIIEMVTHNHHSESPLDSLIYSSCAAHSLLDKLIKRKQNRTRLIGYMLCTKTSHISASDLRDYASKVCSICLEDYKLKDEVITLSCGHQFHGQEIIAWLGQSGACPLCRKKTIVHLVKYVPILSHFLLTIPSIARIIRIREGGECHF